MSLGSITQFTKANEQVPLFPECVEGPEGLLLLLFICFFYLTVTVVVRLRILSLLDKYAASEFVSRTHFYFLSVVSLSAEDEGHRY